MQHIGILNRSSRKPTEKVLLRAFTDWAKAMFVCKPSVSVEFDDTFFLRKKRSSNDQMFTLTNGSFLVENYDVTFSDLAKKAVGYSAIPATEDQKFWDYAIEGIKQSLFTILFGKGALTNIRVCSQKSAHFDSVVKVNLLLDDINLCICFDINISRVLGTHIKSVFNKTPNVLVHRNLVPDKQRVSVQVKLEPVSVNIQELLELSVGDMIPINHQLQDSLVLETADGRLPIKAFLVKQNNCKALLIGK